MSFSRLSAQARAHHQWTAIIAAAALVAAGSACGVKGPPLPPEEEPEPTADVSTQPVDAAAKPTGSSIGKATGKSK